MSTLEARRSTRTPVSIELSVDVGIVAATLGLFRGAGCIHARDCGPRTVLAARLFFGVANAVLIALYASALRYARRLPASPVVVQDISFMEDRMRKSLVKIALVCVEINQWVKVDAVMEARSRRWRWAPETWFPHRRWCSACT